MLQPLLDHHNLILDLCCGSLFGHKLFQWNDIANLSMDVSTAPESGLSNLSSLQAFNVT